MVYTNMQMLEERAVSAEAQEAILTPGGRTVLDCLLGNRKGLSIATQGPGGEKSIYIRISVGLHPK